MNITTVKTEWQHDVPPRGLSQAGTRSGARRYRWWIAGMAGLAVLGGGAYLVQHAKAVAPVADSAKPTSTLTVTVARVETGTLPRTLLVTGSLAARDELPIGTETSGLAISEVLVDVGDHVKQGDVLVRFDNKVLRAQQQQAQAALDEAQANVTEANANARRADELVKSGWISGKDFDNRRATAQTMEARVAVAKANLAFADAKMKQAEIRAPADGTISQRTAHLGAVVSEGELFRMIRDDRVELVAELPETDLALVRPGQTISLKVDGAAEGSPGTSGTVRLVEPTVDVKTRIGRVRIDVAKSAGILPGMFVTGLITLGQTDALVLPERAVVYQDGQPHVLVVDSGGKVESRIVTLGPRDQGRIAVLSGVRAGEQVAMRGATYLKSGDQVTVVESETTPSDRVN